MFQVISTSVYDVVASDDKTKIADGTRNIKAGMVLSFTSLLFLHQTISFALFDYPGLHLFRVMDLKV